MCTAGWYLTVHSLLSLENNLTPFPGFTQAHVPKYYANQLVGIYILPLWEIGVRRANPWAQPAIGACRVSGPVTPRITHKWCLPLVRWGGGGGFSRVYPLKLSSPLGTKRAPPHMSQVQAALVVLRGAGFLLPLYALLGLYVFGGRGRTRTFIFIFLNLNFYFLFFGIHRYTGPIGARPRVRPLGSPPTHHAPIWRSIESTGIYIHKNIHYS